MDFGFSEIGGFEWDKGNLEHIKKHNVQAEECEELFTNKPLIVNEDETHSQKEKRFRVYGRTNENKLITMVSTIRNNKIRIISARDQNKKERKQFQRIGGEKL